VNKSALKEAIESEPAFVDGPCDPQNESVLEKRLNAELKIRHNLNTHFFNTQTIVRRSPDKYMHNPTKVYHTMISNRHFAMYELPGYNNVIISKNKMLDPFQTPREKLKQLIPLVPKFSPRQPESGAFLTQTEASLTSRSILDEKSVISK
jgi:hypothetical protein